MLDAELHSMHYMEQSIAMAAMHLHNPKQTNTTIVYATFQNYLQVRRGMGERILV